MKRITLLTAALVMAACGRGAEDRFASALPSREMVELKVPESTTGAVAREGTLQQALQGDRADTYVVTRVATVWVNGSTAFVLNLLEEITKHRATSVKDNEAVWGPYTDALSPNSWKLVVTKTAAASYSYTLQAKAKSDPDSAFKVILSGAHTKAVDAAGNEQNDFGNGSFLIDWNAAQTLPEHDTNVGSAEFSYSRMSASSQITVDVTFTQVRDQETNQLINAEYAYASTPGQGGEFQFVWSKDIDGNPLPEKLSILSRWTQAGAGRADLRATGGNLTSTATASECWDSAFRSQYLYGSWAMPQVQWGTEAAGCTAFPTRKDPAL